MFQKKESDSYTVIEVSDVSTINVRKYLAIVRFKQVDRLFLLSSLPAAYKEVRSMKVWKSDISKQRWGRTKPLSVLIEVRDKDDNLIADAFFFNPMIPQRFLIEIPSVLEETVDEIKPGFRVRWLDGR